jgi:WD40 repeat protein
VIEAYLGDTPEPARSVLLRELLGLELAYRRHRGESPTHAEYGQLFPQHVDLIQRAFREESLSTGQGPPAQADQAANAPGPFPEIPGYDMLDELGRGGMGVVYRARQRRAQRLVALKMILAGGHAGPEAAARFAVEVEAVARLQHPHIVQIYDVGEHDGRPYFALEYVDGGSLEKKLTGTPQPARAAAEMVETLARAMHHAHRQGIVHRDLKPANVLLTADGTPKVTDFGLAKLLVGGGGMQTQSGAILGTPSYMAPEQAGGKSKDIGPAVDVYTLGAILYEMLTGRPPFRGETPLETLQQVQSTEPVPPSRLQPRLPRDLTTICLKCLQKEPAKRYASALALAEDLRRFLTNRPIQARRTGVPERAWRWYRRNPALGTLAVAVAALLVVLAVGSLFAARQFQEERDRVVTSKAEVEMHQVHLQTNLYFTCIALAEQELSAANVARAEELLEACPEQRRAWEWHYLKRRRYGEPLALSDAPIRPLVGSVCFSPDGRCLAAPFSSVFPFEGVVKVWDTTTWKELPPLMARYRGQIASVAYSPDGKHLALAGRTWQDSCAEVTLRDAQTGKERFPPWRGDKGTICLQVAFSPDSRWLAAPYDNRQQGTGVVKIWDTANGKELHTLPGHVTGFSSVKFSPDGRHLATGSWDGLIQIWKCETGEEVLCFQGHTEQVWNLAYSKKDGKWLLASASFDRTINVWDAMTGEKICTLAGHLGPVVSVAFNDDGTRLASASFDQTVKIWDVVRAREALTLRAHRGPVWNVAFSPDGRQLASAGPLERVVRVWDATPPKAIPTLHGPEGIVSQVAFGPNGQYLATASWDQTVRLWDAETHQEVRKLCGHSGPVTGVAFCRGGRQLASSGVDKTVRLWDLATGAETHTLKHARSLHAIAFSPDAQHVAAAGDDGAVIVWEVATGEKALPLRLSSRVTSVAFSHDGQQLAATSVQGRIEIWKTKTDKVVCLAPGDLLPLSCVVFSPDGRRLATAGFGRIVKLWDLATHKSLDLTDSNEWLHDKWVLSLAFSPDGERLAAGCADSTVRLWDLASGPKLGPPIRGHLGPVYSVAFNPDGRRLAAASGYASKGEVKVWDLTAIKEPDAFRVERETLLGPPALFRPSTAAGL